VTIGEKSVLSRKPGTAIGFCQYVGHESLDTLSPFSVADSTRAEQASGTPER
jgi:hypothetical protein